MVALLKRIFNCFILILFFNLPIIISFLPMQNVFFSIVIGVALFGFYIFYNIKPNIEKCHKTALKMLNAGFELSVTAILCLTMEILLSVCVLVFIKPLPPIHILLINCLLCLLFMTAMFINGMIRIFVFSKQISLTLKICLLLLWWFPVLNIILLKKVLRTAGIEYIFTIEKHSINSNRIEQQICKTRYPLLMVHGIFFRDWKNFNYWGRIPEELEFNGATIFYGNHQSSASVEQSADELRQCILNIVNETNCEKVNIIAHSKGGIDSRYAISCLGMGEYVASLTTINTPHYGCNYASILLEKTPDSIVKSIGRKYEKLFAKLGDEDPDFYSGLAGLTDKACAEFNVLMKDDEKVLYQSVGSKMKSWRGAVFPLNLGHEIIKRTDGENDGLVAVDSMKWGGFLGVISPKGKQGISHGDMIDLTRKDIEGFDVREFYVDLVSKLKAKGL